MRSVTSGEILEARPANESAIACMTIRDRAARIAAIAATQFMIASQASRVKDTLEAFAVLKEDQYPQYRGHQSRRNTRRRKRQVKRKDVEELGLPTASAQGARRSPKAIAAHREQLNSRRKNGGEMRLADGDEKLNRRADFAGGGWWMKLRNPFNEKTVKIFSPSR